jgi:hypothetical protein
MYDFRVKNSVITIIRRDYYTTTEIRIQGCMASYYSSVYTYAFFEILHILCYFCAFIFCYINIRLNIILQSTPRSPK